MNEETVHVSKKTVVYRLAGMDEVMVRGDIACRTAAGDDVAIDVYAPPGRSDAATAAVIVVAGYPDTGFEAQVGCRFKEMGSTVSWGRLIAASGMVAITYSAREPVAALDAVLACIRADAAALGVDAMRIGLWASSGHVPLAVSALMREGVRCAALCYGYTLDLAGSTGVADAARAFGFANPGVGRSVAEIPNDVPIFVARAGRDACPSLNVTLDRFVHEALGANLPITVVNYADAPHAFDLDCDTEETRVIVRQILGFLGRHLLG